MVRTPSALDGATKAHNYDPKYFADVQKRLGDATLRLEDTDRCGIDYCPRAVDKFGLMKCDPEYPLV
jgi:hypothetical protein